MESYSKLQSSIIQSSVWAEDSDTRCVWITMLAMSDRYGYVAASVLGLANAARVKLPKCEEALAKFLAPDPYSRSTEHDGRRIELAERGWNLLNYEKIRNERDTEARRAIEREKKARQRVRKAATVPGNVPSVPGQSPKCPPHAEAEAEAEAEADPKKEITPHPSGASPSPSEGDLSHGDLDSFQADPKKPKAKRAPRAAKWTRFPADFEPDDSHRELARSLGVNLAEQMARIRDYEFKTPKSDAAATLRNWLRTSPTLGGVSRQSQPKQPNGGAWKPRVERPQ